MNARSPSSNPGRRTPASVLRSFAARVGRPSLLVLLGIGILGAVAIVRLGARREASAAPVTLEAVARRDIALTVEATGTVEPIDLVEVKSKASGQIVRMPVQVGSEVRAGDLLAQIDTRDVQNQYAQSYAALSAAQAKLSISRTQKQRADALFAQQVITAPEYEAAALDFADAQAQVVKARTDLDLARQRRDDATVRAPSAGTVLEQLVSNGQVISSATSSASGGTSLLKMADLSRIRMRALVAESDVGNIRPGLNATITVDAFPNRTFQGQVERIEPQAVVQQSVTMFPVLLSLSNESRLLLPGMNGEVSMLIEQRNDVPAIPVDAVRSVRELPAVASALGLDPDSVKAQVQRQMEERARERQARFGAGDSSGAGVWRGRGARGDSSGAGARRGQGRRFGGAGGAGRASRAQAVLVKTARGLEPRVVRLGLSDFDYAQVISGLKEGDQVVLLSVAELQAKRKQDQSRIRERLGSGIPGSGTGGGGGRGGAGRGAGGR